VPRKRSTPINLSAEERRVLDAFYCGRIPAGRLNQALAQARRQQTTQAIGPDPQRTMETAAPLQLAA
jgi:hypothetical protein